VTISRVDLFHAEKGEILALQRPVRPQKAKAIALSRVTLQGNQLESN
jgi:hypothetical protein